jgi:hypothetical protein
VARDGSGNFSAGTITATLSGSATSATTATNLAGGAANQIAFQSGAGATTFATAPSASNQVLNWNGSAFTWSAGTISGIPLGSNLNTLTLGSYLTGTSYNGSTNVTAAVDATDANTASKVVARDGSGNFSAGTITASLSGNASTATTLATARTINGVSFNGSANITVTATATNALTIGTGLSGTSYNGSSAVTIANSGVTSITGTSNQVVASASTGSVTLSLPQSINTAASVQFGSFGVGTAASGTTGEIRATNNITAYYSDDRLKNRLGKIENALDKLCSLDGFYYEANETAQALGYEVKREVGVSAQQIQAILPEIVAPAPIDERYLTVRYERALPLVVEAIKELRAELQMLKKAVTK